MMEEEIAAAISAALLIAQRGAAPPEPFVWNRSDREPDLTIEELRAGAHGS